MTNGATKVDGKMEIEIKQKPIRTYVIRGGRITDAQKKAFDRWWPEYGLSLHDGIIDNSIFANNNPLILEIGFGMGDSLLQMAASTPGNNFIGIEVHPPGVGRLLNNAGKARLHNLKVYMADAVDVLQDCIPDDSLERLQLFFPDPWHKKKHHKRRIVQPPFAQLVCRKLISGKTFHVATDWHDYAEYMMEVLTLSKGLRNAVAEYQYSPPPGYRPRTKFEARGERLGHGVWDLVFKKEAS